MRKRYYNDNDELFSNSRDKIAYKTPRKKVVANTIIIILSLILAIGGGALVYGNSILAGMYAPSTTEVTSSQQIDEVSSSVSITNNMVKDPMVMNIVLFGSDTRWGGKENGNSDSILLVSIDNRRHKLKLTSFMRDIAVYIPKINKTAKLNAAYSVGGPPCAIETIERNFGVTIDRFVVFSFESFPSVIDDLGGVDVTVNEQEAKYLDHDFNRFKSAGDYHLNGEEALDYSRMRYSNTGDDYMRTQRQRNVMMSLLNKFKTTTDVSAIAKLMTKLLPEISTNITVNEMTNLAKNSIKYMNYPVSQFRLPTQGNFRDDKGSSIGSALVIEDMNRAREDLARFLYEETVDSIYGSTSSKPPEVGSSQASSSKKS